MTTTFPTGHGDGAEVVPLRPVRDNTPPEDGEPPAPVPARPIDPDGQPGPASAAADPPVLEGEIVRVDQPGHDRGDWLEDLAARSRQRRPLIHPALRSPSEAAATARWIGGHYAHVSGFHAIRAPLYGARLAGRAPVGLARLASGAIRWTFDLEGEPVRRGAVLRADPEHYLKLSRQRDARVRLRVWVAGAGLAALTAGTTAVALGNGVVQAVVIGLAVLVLGRIGRPADRPIISPAVTPHRVEKLTSDMVTRALTSIGIGAITSADRKNPGAISFPAPITRDGPGWRADVDLPHGVTVSDVLERRPRLASALRRPLGCVWPEGDSTIHEGRLILWVGDRDLSRVTTKWPLARAARHDVFKGLPMGNDPRGRGITVPLIQHNILTGSQPGQGKTGAMRELVCGAALDPTAELWLHELKGSGDFDPLAKVAHRFTSGIDDESIAYAAKSLNLLRAELERRAAALKKLPPDVCPDKRVTRQIADRRSLGLHPLIVVIDECQNLFAHAAYGDQAGEDAEFVIKLGRAYGVVLILATQRPDKRSLPTGVSANVSIRFCLRVGGQTENDMILGTSAYQNGIRATTFVPETDAGIGYLVGATPSRRSSAPRGSTWPRPRRSPSGHAPCAKPRAP
jgi:S-DNA-T family DNA segregation ATPase FtsK/SpoIIIE